MNHLTQMIPGAFAHRAGILAAALSLCLGGPGVAETKDDVVKNIEAFEKFDLDQIEETVKSFLESDTVEDRLKFVRQPERVKARMIRHYGGNKISPEGMEEINRSEVSYRGQLFTAMVLTGDFSWKAIAVERQGDDYLVDWESWVGFCELSPEEMRKQKPVKPVEVRAIVSESNYYNFDFSDESQWRSYQLKLMDSDSSFTGYLKKGSEFEKALIPLKKKDFSSPYILKVAFPPESKSTDLVEIVEVVNQGWITVDPAKE